MKLLAYLFIYKAERLPLFGKFTDGRESRESKRVIGSKHLDIDNHFVSNLRFSYIHSILCRKCVFERVIIYL